MKLLVLAFLLFIPLVYAHSVQEEGSLGNYTIQLSTIPEQLEPGQSDMVIAVLQNGTPVADKDVWVRLSSGRKIYLAGTFHTDEVGTVTFSYYFNTPGVYDLTLDVDNERTVMQVPVHGQYVLIFGFLSAIFIVLALLLEKL